MLKKITETIEKCMPAMVENCNIQELYESLPCQLKDVKYNHFVLSGYSIVYLTKDIADDYYKLTEGSLALLKRRLSDYETEHAQADESDIITQEKKEADKLGITYDQYLIRKLIHVLSDTETLNIQKSVEHVHGNTQTKPTNPGKPAKPEQAKKTQAGNVLKSSQTSAQTQNTSVAEAAKSATSEYVNKTQTAPTKQKQDVSAKNTNHNSKTQTANIPLQKIDDTDVANMNKGSMATDNVSDLFMTEDPTEEELMEEEQQISSMTSDNGNGAFRNHAAESGYAQPEVSESAETNVSTVSKQNESSSHKPTMREMMQSFSVDMDDTDDSDEDDDVYDDLL